MRLLARAALATLLLAAACGDDIETAPVDALPARDAASTPRDQAAALDLALPVDGIVPIDATLSIDAIAPVDGRSRFDASATADFAVQRDASVPADLAPAPAIYWGALEDGPDTYDYYYGPPNFWQNAPWGNTGNTMDRFDSNAGKKVSLLHYGQPPPWDQTTFYPGTMDIVWNRGAVPIVTMSLGTSNLADVASGKHDAAIQTWAASVKAYGKPFFLRFAWEMNGNWYSWGQQPAAYIAAWQHFRTVVDGVGASNVTWLWCPNLDGGPYHLAAYYPGDAYVDWMGIDGYNKGNTSQSFASLYQASYDQLTAISSKPILVAEISSLEYSGAKAAWITDLLSTQLPTAFPQIKGFSWFNWRFYETDAGVTGYQPFPIESSTSAQQAFHDNIASSYYLAGGSFPLPAQLSKVPLP